MPRKKLTSGIQDRWYSMDREEWNDLTKDQQGDWIEYQNHNCEHEPVYYEFYEDGHRYHGYECGHCGKLLQTG